jgi:hypothetical protein
MPREITSDRLEAATQDLKKELREHGGAAPIDVLVRHLARQQVVIDSLVEQLGVLEAALRARDVLVCTEDRDESSYPNRATVSADFRLAAEDGFYAIEHDHYGRPYRWTGPTTTFGFDLYVSRTSALSATLELLSAPPEVDLAQLRCYCDHREQKLERATQSEMLGLSTVLPPRTGLGKTRLEFEVPRVIRPSEREDGGGDKRLLGVAFVRLSVEPCADRSADSSEPSRGTSPGGAPGGAGTTAERRDGE